MIPRLALADGLRGLLVSVSVLVSGLTAGQAERPAIEGVLVRLDQLGGGGQPERGEQKAGEDVGGVMLAPVHAGGGDRDRHDDRGDQEQEAPPAPRVADDQDRYSDIEARGGG